MTTELIHIKFFIICYCAVISCQSSPPKKKQRVKTAQGEAISYDELTTPEGASTTITTAPHRAKTEQKLKIECSERLLDYIRSIKILYEKHAKAIQYRQDSIAKALATLKDIDCQNEDSRNALYQLVRKNLAEHQNKVTIILPLTGSKAEIGLAIINGMKTLTKELKKNFDDYFTVKDSGGNIEKAEMLFAEAALKDRAAFIISGVFSNEAQILSNWAERIAIPMFALSSTKGDIPSSQHSFRVFPNELEMAQTLANAAKYREFNKVAVLFPDNQAAQIFADFLTIHLKAVNIEVVHQERYIHGQYDSMESISKNIFQIDVAKRRDEYLTLVKEARKKAREADVPFNDRLVSLPPIVNFDAVFILDHFRNVRHFVKIFKYLGVEQLPLLGGHEWRSKDLLDPPEPFLEGAIFADFIGSYKELPKGISPQAVDSDYFLKPGLVMQVDYQIIGYHAANIAIETLQRTQSPRHEIYGDIKSLKLNYPSYFRSGPIFDQHHNSHWPTFLFTIREHQLVPFHVSDYVTFKKQATNQP